MVHLSVCIFVQPYSNKTMQLLWLLAENATLMWCPKSEESIEWQRLSSIWDLSKLKWSFSFFLSTMREYYTLNEVPYNWRKFSDSNRLNLSILFSTSVCILSFNECKKRQANLHETTRKMANFRLHPHAGWTAVWRHNYSRFISIKCHWHCCCCWRHSLS